MEKKAQFAIPPEKMKKFKEKFLLSMDEKIKVMRDLAEKWKVEHKTETLKELLQHAHMIAGSAGTFGFSRASEIARSFETHLAEQIRSTQDASTKPLPPEYCLEQITQIEGEFSHAR